MSDPGTAEPASAGASTCTRDFSLAPAPGHALDLVVARYEESLNWLRKVPPAWHITVYDKGASQGDPSILPAFRKADSKAEVERVKLQALPNVGREAHTYLHHITSRLASQPLGSEPLAEVTVFCQGRPFDHASDFHATLKSLADEPSSLGGWRWLGHIIDTDSSNGALFRAWSKNPEGQGLDISGFHRALLGLDGPSEYAFVLGGQFAVRRRALQARGPQFWRHALELSLLWPHAAHCFERTWDKVLGLPGPTSEQMAGRRTVYLKRIRGEEPRDEAGASTCGA